MPTTKLTAPWGAIAEAVQDAGPGATVTVTATKLVVRVTPADPKGGDARDFTVALPARPVSGAVAKKTVTDELASRGVDAGTVRLLVAAEETIDVGGVIDRLRELGRAIERRTWLTYSYRGQAPPPIRTVDGHPVWLTTDVDAWQLASPTDGRPRKERWPARSPRKPESSRARIAE